MLYLVEIPVFNDCNDGCGTEYCRLYYQGNAPPTLEQIKVDTNQAYLRVKGDRDLEYEWEGALKVLWATVNSCNCRDDYWYYSAEIDGDKYTVLIEVLNPIQI